MGVFITLPYVNRSLLKNYLYSKDSMYDMVKILNTFSGGAIENASIFSLGIVPYITSSIMVSLFFTFFRRLKDKQENIQKNQGLFTFILALIISTFQSIIAAKYLKNLYFNSEPIVNNIEGINFFFICIITLTTGTIILIWISEKITKEGLGNGPSILIVTGILAKTPSSISYLYRGFIDLKYSISDIGAVFFFFFYSANSNIYSGIRRTPNFNTSYKYA
jgi:preprotein translocase subunit SecY